MDANEWSVFTQLLRQAGNAKKADTGNGSVFPSADDQQYGAVPMSQAVYVLDTQRTSVDVPGQYSLQLTGDGADEMQVSGISYSGTDVSELFQDKTGGQMTALPSGAVPVNGATRSSVETNVMKSLLTGQQYVQSSKNHQLSRTNLNSTGQGSRKSAAIAQAAANYGKVGCQTEQQKLSMLDSAWQQQQIQSQLGTGGFVVNQDDSAPRLICSDTLPESVVPGEKVYVYMDGVAYEIVTGSNQELIAQPSIESSLPLTTGISLEDLANVSAEQESLKLADFQASVGEANLANASASMIHQAQLGLELLQGVALQDGSSAVDGQHYLQLQQPVQQSQIGTSMVTGEQESMQVVVMQSEDGSSRLAQTGRGGEVIKLGLQDLMLQTGQSLPPELQELVARGIDLSNCEFVIQDGDEMQHNSEVYLSSSDANQFQGAMTTELHQQLASVMNNSTMFANSAATTTGYGEVIQPLAVMNSNMGIGSVGGLQNVNSNNVLALLASTAVANQEQHTSVAVDASNLQNQTPVMQMFAPEDEDDGEFAFLVMDQEECAADDLVDVASRQKPCDAFLSAFVGFIQGNKAETLSSVANSTIVNKPALPKYNPDLCRRPAPAVRQQVIGRTIDGVSGAAHKTKSTKAPVTVSLVFTDPSGPSLVSVGGDRFPGAGSGVGESVKQISVTPFIVQNIDGKSVVLPGTEMQKYLPKVTSRSEKAQRAQNEGISEKGKLSVERNAKEKISKIIKRKMRGSDDESCDESDNELGAISYMSDSDSDPAWKPTLEESWLKKHGTVQPDVRPTRGRGRGRGRLRTAGRGANHAATVQQPSTASSDSNSATVGYILQVGSEGEQGLVSSASKSPSDPHGYQKGDFVVERRDIYKYGGFPIWKIEAGRLLQKYDPIPSDVGIIHQSASVYSSWSGDIRANFKAITVDAVNTAGRRFETVKVRGEYMPLPPDESLEQDAMMELFNIYVQNVLSQALDAQFLTAIKEQQEEYYLGPLRQIDGLLLEAQETILAQISWTDNFKTVVDRCPYYQMSDASPQAVEQMHCQATSDNSCPVVKTVKFFGPWYNPDLLHVTEEAEKAAVETFCIGQASVNQLCVYHALHHYKFLLFKKCEEEVQYLKQKKDKSDETILAECLQNRIFVQQCLRHLKQLLEKCSIVITVVTKTDAEGATQ